MIPNDLIFSSSSIFHRLFRTSSIALITTSMTINLMFHNFLISLTSLKYLSIFTLFFIHTVISQNSKNLFSSCLPPPSQPKLIWSGLGDLFQCQSACTVPSTSHLPTQSCIFLHYYWANLLHLLIMWCTVSFI